ncbi:MAG: hypothetical protein HY554_07845 [Elusimicrobia bacterium]|nr:hypothetical protein [Elusimicrobiota bacterium]
MKSILGAAGLAALSASSGLALAPALGPRVQAPLSPAAALSLAPAGLAQAGLPAAAAALPLPWSGAGLAPELPAAGPDMFAAIHAPAESAAAPGSLETMSRAAALIFEIGGGPAEELPEPNPLSPTGEWTPPVDLPRHRPRQSIETAGRLARYIDGLDLGVEDEVFGTASRRDLAALRNALDVAVELALTLPTGHKLDWDRAFALGADALLFRVAAAQVGHRGSALAQSMDHLAASAAKRDRPWWLRSQTLANLRWLIEEFPTRVRERPELRLAVRGSLESILRERALPADARASAQAALAQIAD